MSTGEPWPFNIPSGTGQTVRIEPFPVAVATTGTATGER